MEKIKQEMNRQMTLGRFLTIILPLLIVLLGWAKVHEERQEEELKKLSESKVEHEQRITALEDFKNDIKLYQAKQDKNHIETLEAISGLNTNLEVLVERIKHTSK